MFWLQRRGREGTEGGTEGDRAARAPGSPEFAGEPRGTWAEGLQQPPHGSPLLANPTAPPATGPHRSPSRL